MLSKRDYFLMAEVFRKIYLENKRTIFQRSGNMYMDILSKFMDMLEEDNPKFRRDYFLGTVPQLP